MFFRGGKHSLYLSNTRNVRVPSLAFDRSFAAARTKLPRTTLDNAYLFFLHKLGSYAVLSDPSTAYKGSLRNYQPSRWADGQRRRCTAGSTVVVAAAAAAAVAVAEAS